MALTRPRAYQIDSTIESISDPITVLHAGATLANVDVGFLVNRANGLLSNVAIYWSESSGSFVTAYTTSSGGADSNIAVTSYAPITVGNLITTNGVFWANGSPYSSGSGGGSYGNTQVAQYLPTYTGNVNAANVVVTSGVYSPAYFYANGTPFSSSSYGNTQVAAYLPTYTGNIGVTATLTTGNIITTSGVFWANGNAYSSGSAVTTTTGFSTNPNTITSNVTINSGYNAQAIGPITVSPGGVLTVLAGQRVVIL